MSRRNLEVLSTRWRAGTLSALNIVEQVFFLSSFGPAASLSGVGARLWVVSARDAVDFWPFNALDAAALRDVRDAICAVLEADAGGKLFAQGQSPESNDTAATAVLSLRDDLVDLDSTGERTPQQIAELVRDLGLTSVQLSALKALGKRIEDASFDNPDAVSRLALQEARMKEIGNALAARAAAAEAKYGLQRCALPACAAQEPAARTYKRCSRCGTVYYCCAAHQQEDWKRHKQADGCKKPA
jgi:hypothetical protein